MEEQINEKNQIIENYIINIVNNNPGVFTKEQIQKALDRFKNSDESLENIIATIDSITNELIDNSNKQREYLEEMSKKYNNSEYQTKNIIDMDISQLSYEQIENMFFHYSWKKYLESYDKDGIKPIIGENSDGIDPEASIFFSKGVEGVLELWDVWLKWRLNRQNNPQYKGNTPEEIKATIERFKHGSISDEERKNWYYWMDTLKEKRYLSNNEMLVKLFEYQYNEMLNSDYLIMDLKENEEFKYDQIDIKKETAIEESKRSGRNIDPITSYQYGAYSDFSTPIVDKWNMQTIPGKDMTIEPSRLKRLNVNGKNDVYSIMKFMYDKYKKEVSPEQQIKFDVLDRYVQYVEQKKNYQSMYADQIVEAMTNGQLDTNGKPLVQNIEQQKVIVKGMENGYAKLGVLGLVTALISIVIVVLGVLIIK